MNVENTGQYVKSQDELDEMVFKTNQQEIAISGCYNGPMVEDCYDFIPSPDIAEYCESKNSQFTQLDMAIIIAVSEKPQAEKHAAWRRLIEGYADRPIPGNGWFEARDSLHNYLKERIKHEERGDEADDFIESLFIHLPVPFKKGDILTMPCGKPGVLVMLPHWFDGKPVTYQELVDGPAPSYEMCASFYFFDDEGIRTRDHTWPNSLYFLRYHKDDLRGHDQFLTKLSYYCTLNEEELLEEIVQLTQHVTVSEIIEMRSYRRLS